MTKTTLKVIVLGFLSAEPLRPLRSVAGAALVAQRLAAVIAACCFFRVELDRFHCSTARMLWLQSGLTFLEHLRGVIWREVADHLLPIIHSFQV